MTGAQLGMLLMYSLGKDKITSVFNNPQRVSTYVTETSSIVNDVTNKSDGGSRNIMMAQGWERSL